MIWFHKTAFVFKYIFLKFQRQVQILFLQSKISEKQITHVEIMMCHVISIKCLTFVCILDMQIRYRRHGDMFVIHKKANNLVLLQYSCVVLCNAVWSRNGNKKLFACYIISKSKSGQSVINWKYIWHLLLDILFIKTLVIFRLAIGFVQN